MPNLSPPSTRVSVGSVMVGGQRLEVVLDAEWARYFQSLNTQVVTTGNAVGQPGAPGTTGAAGAAVSFASDAEGGVEFIPVKGPQGDPGVPGPALFMLSQQEMPDMLPIIPTQLTEAFIAPTLLNSWVYWGVPFSQPGYCKDAAGFVHLRGLLKSGVVTAGTGIFVLPAGYRPVDTEIFSVSSNSAFGEVRVDAAGNVQIQVGSASFLSLDGITFKAA